MVNEFGGVGAGVQAAVSVPPLGVHFQQIRHEARSAISYLFEVEPNVHAALGVLGVILDWTVREHAANVVKEGGQDDGPSVNGALSFAGNIRVLEQAMTNIRSRANEARDALRMGVHGVDKAFKNVVEIEWIADSLHNVTSLMSGGRPCNAENLLAGVSDVWPTGVAGGSGGPVVSSRWYRWKTRAALVAFVVVKVSRAERHAARVDPREAFGKALEEAEALGWVEAGAEGAWRVTAAGQEVVSACRSGYCESKVAQAAGVVPKTPEEIRDFYRVSELHATQ